MLNSATEYEERYVEKELLGEGGFGKVGKTIKKQLRYQPIKHLSSKVYRVECRKSGGSFAAKQLVTTRKKQRDSALAEVNLIKDLASPYIIR